MNTLLKNTRILDHDNVFVKKDILFNASGILKIADEVIDEHAIVIDAKQCVAIPGLIDVHAHLREPGTTHKETIASGTKAAAKGGFTTIMAMPNVIPYPDNVEVMETYLALLEKEAVVNTIPYACISKQEAGKELVDMASLKAMGIYAFSDDGVGVAKDDLMLEAMKKSADLDILIVAHTEDMKYRKPLACMHEGERSKQLGYIGIPSACEAEQLKRDLMLVEKTNAHYHVCHMSAKESVAYLKAYKEKGCDVTGEVTVHHLLLHDHNVQDDANYKMNPPLRTKEDQEALLQGLKDGVIDIIANDHAPHSEEEKARGMEKAPFGIVSLETAFPLLYTNLVTKGVVTLEQLLTWMSEAPAKRFGFHRKGKLAEGYDADIVLIDIENRYPIDKATFVSKGKNTPFQGWCCTGYPVLSIVEGSIVYESEAR